MNEYRVLRRSDGAEVYRYSEEAPVEWSDFPFAEYDHVLVEAPIEDVPVEPVNQAEWRINVGPFFDRFGAQKLPILASTDPMVQAIIKDCTVRKYLDLYGRRGDIEVALNILVSKGFTVDVSSILEVKPALHEVYRGD